MNGQYNIIIHSCVLNYLVGKHNDALMHHRYKNIDEKNSNFIFPRVIHYSIYQFDI